MINNKAVHSFVDRAEGSTKKLRIGGFEGECLRGNINNWQLSVLGRNPNILAQLYADPEKADFTRLVEWYNEFPGKLLTGMAFSYILEPSEALYTSADNIARGLAAARKENGYLGTYPPEKRFGGNGTNWDVWGQYHIAYGLLSWYRVCGERYALDTAVSVLDGIYDHFVNGGISFYSAGCQTMNYGVSHGFAEMYRETGDRRYLDAAIQIVEVEWRSAGNWLENSIAGMEYWQSELPRWEALHTLCTLGTLYEFTGETKYMTALEQIWSSIAEYDRHNHGGFSTHEAAVGNPYAEGAVEFCCTVAWMALTTEYLQLSKAVIAADELELSWLNSVTGSYLDGGRIVTYDTPMRGVPRIPSQVSIAFQYNPASPDFNCCQANAARGVGQVSQWAYLTDSETIYVCRYGESEGVVRTPSGGEAVITQSTDYPVSGSIRLTVSPTSPERFRLNLRVPTWSAGAIATLPDGTVLNGKAGEWLCCDREWKANDSVILDIGMTVRVWYGERELAGKCSVYYGPVLLCAEGEDAARITSAPLLDISALSKTEVKRLDDRILFTVDLKDGSCVCLRDFATAGRELPFDTWFMADGENEAADGKFKWCGGIIEANNINETK